MCIMKAHSGNKVIAPVTLNLGTRYSLGIFERRKFSCCCQEWNLDYSAHNLVTIPDEPSQLLKTTIKCYNWVFMSQDVILCHWVSDSHFKSIGLSGRWTHHNPARCQEPITQQHNFSSQNTRVRKSVGFVMTYFGLLSPDFQRTTDENQ